MKIFKYRLPALALAISVFYSAFSAAMEHPIVFRNGSTGSLSEVSFFGTYEVKKSTSDLPLGIKIPSDFDGFKYITIAISQSKNSGGWKIIASIMDGELKYCLSRPDLLSHASMALTTPYLLVGHNHPLKIRESFACA